MRRFITASENRKVHDIVEHIGNAYWRVWFGRPLFNHRKVGGELQKAKKLMKELGV